MSVRREEDIPEDEVEESKENPISQKLDDQEIEPIEEVVPHKIGFYKQKNNWLHSQQSNICEIF